MRTLSYFPLVLGLVASLPEHRLRGMLTVNSNQTRQTQAVGRVVKLRLIDADTDQPIAAYDPLPTPLAEVDLSRLGSATNFNIEAITDGIVGSILWKNNGITRNEDNSSRWALCGNKGSDFSSCGGFRLGGSISISAMPFTGRASSGTPGVALSTQVTIVSSTASDVKPPKLTLINADTNLDIGELLGGAIIDLSKTPRLNVRAEPDPSVATGSVRFEYDERWFRTENGAIFAFAGNQGIDYFSWTPSVGVHTITATAHRDRDASGTEWPKSSVTFSVVSQPQAPTPAAPVPAAPIVTPRPQASVSKKPTVAPRTKAPRSTAPVSKRPNSAAPAAKVPTTKAPASTTPRTGEPTLSPLTSPSTLKGCYIRELSTKKEIELTGNVTYVVDPVSNPVGYSIRCEVSGSPVIDFIKFFYDGNEHDEFGEPRWLDGDSFPSDYIVPVPYLSTCGPKTITAQGNIWSRVVFEKVLSLVAQCPVTTAPVAKAPTVAPAAPITKTKAPSTKAPHATSPTAPVASPSALKGCYLRELSTKKETTLSGSDSYVVDQQANPKGYSIRCDVTGAEEVNFIKFFYGGNEHDEFGEPRWMDGDSFPTDYIVPVPYLSLCGPKNFTVQGNSWSSVRFQKVFSLEAQCSITKAPSMGPTPAPVKIAAPVTNSPTAAPVETETVDPSPAPQTTAPVSTVPVATSTPTRAPILQTAPPVTLPTRAPVATITPVVPVPTETPTYFASVTTLPTISLAPTSDNNARAAKASKKQQRQS